jgi:uncharacterized iron-regulated membrane protein
MNVRAWSRIHRWSSLVCTVFMLLLCLTGLPLIFHEEIGHLSGEVEAPPLPAVTSQASMDQIARTALDRRPGEVIKFLSWDDDEHPHQTFVTLAKSVTAPPNEFSSVIVDSRTAEVLDEPKFNEGFMAVMFRLHVDLFAGLPGMLFLGSMGLLLVVAIVSGLVLYYPFTRRLAFGTVRVQRSTRVRWLDLHNLLGIVTLVWALVVGITGVVNTLSQVVLGIWQRDQMAEMIAPYQGRPSPTSLASLDKALQVAHRAVPDMEISFVAFPGTDFSSPHHYTVFFKGTTPLTARLLKPALIDAETAAFTDAREMPWYVKTLLLSQPLHFGDYGGLPLKIVWAVLDVITIIVLGSGLYLWLRKPGGAERPSTATSDVAIPRPGPARQVGQQPGRLGRARPPDSAQRSSS